MSLTPTKHSDNLLVDLRNAPSNQRAKMLQGGKVSSNRLGSLLSEIRAKIDQLGDDLNAVHEAKSGEIAPDPAKLQAAEKRLRDARQWAYGILGNVWALMRLAANETRIKIVVPPEPEWMQSATGSTSPTAAYLVREAIGTVREFCESARRL